METPIENTKTEEISSSPNISKHNLLVLSVLLNIVLIAIIIGVLMQLKEPKLAEAPVVNSIGVPSKPVIVEEDNTPVNPKISVKTFDKDGISFDYPDYLTIDPSNNQIIRYDPSKEKEANSSVHLLDPNTSNTIFVSKATYQGKYGEGWGYGSDWEGANVTIKDDPEMNLSGLDVTILDSKTLDSRIYLASDKSKTFTYEIIVSGSGGQFINNAEIVVRSLKDSN